MVAAQLKPSVVTVGDWTREAGARLDAVGVESARLDARLLMARVLGGGVERVVSESRTALRSDQSETLERILIRREAREPLSHILGRREFWGLDFRVTPATLTPRADSETVIEAVLDAYPDKTATLRILDLGTGSGCLLLALLHEYPHASGLGVDASAEALLMAKENADALGLGLRATFDQGNWCQGIGETFDLVVSNPPYIPDADVPGLMAEVSRYEPHSALKGGPDGLDAYRLIANDLDSVLKKGASVFFEVGQGQALEVGNTLKTSGFMGIGQRADLAGCDRCVWATCQG